MMIKKDWVKMTLISSKLWFEDRFLRAQGVDIHNMYGRKIINPDKIVIQKNGIYASYNTDGSINTIVKAVTTNFGRKDLYFKGRVLLTDDSKFNADTSLGTDRYCNVVYFKKIG